MAKSTKIPKTVLDKAVAAIRALKSHKGSSRQAIAKFLKEEYGSDNAAALRTALKKGAANGTLLQTGQSFRVAQDGEYEAPADETVRVRDVAIGDEDGRRAEAGDSVVVSYVGTLSDGTRFDSAKSFPFTLGAGDVIKGWDQGLLGMRVGGKRQLVVPSKLGYGKKGCKPDIPPDAELRFNVKMKGIE
jgi:FKBP-type peptidyl-prolyl cis-trans isomerase